MTVHAAVTLAVLGGAVLLFLSDRVRPDLVALLVVAALGLSGVLSPTEAFSGFGSPAVAVIVAIFVLAEALRFTGVTDRVGTLLLRLAGTGERRLVMVVMLAGAFLSLFMNNTAAASLLLPAASSAGRRAGVSLSRLLMPLAFATILGGTATLFTTTNLVVAGILKDAGYAPYGLLDFAPVGLPLVVVGVAYMGLWGVRLLPRQSPADLARTTEGDLLGVYRLGERLFRARVLPGSPLEGKSLADAAFREACGSTVVAIDRRDRVTLSPAPDAVLHEGDVLLLEGRREEFDEVARWGCLEVLEEAPERALESETVAVVEAVLSPRSGLIGQTLTTAHFREKYGMTALALWRAGTPTRTGIREMELQFGDALLLQGPRERLGVLRAEPDLIVLDAGVAEPRSPEKGRLAVAIVLLTLLAAALEWPPTSLAMLAGALALILVRVIPADAAYQAIEWRTIFLVAGMLPVSVAMARSGAADFLADALLRGLGGAGPLVLVCGVFGLAALLAQAMSGTAVAAVVAPVAILAAQRLGADPRAVAMAVVLGASMAFPTPLGHPVNLLVMGPGGYRFRDFLVVGIPLALLLFGVTAALLPVFWPLTPVP